MNFYTHVPPAIQRLPQGLTPLGEIRMEDKPRKCKGCACTFRTAENSPQKFHSISCQEQTTGTSRYQLSQKPKSDAN